MNWLKNLFKSKPPRIWREDKREFLRTERKLSNDPYTLYDYFNYYAVYYTDILTGETKVEEIRELG